MMSRTVRYFKLVYIVAGILLSNEDICETVDQIHIAPRMDVKDKKKPPPEKKKRQLAIEDKTQMKTTWLKGFFDFKFVERLKQHLTPKWPALSVWAIPNFFIDYSTSLFCRKFVLNSDCDMIYK